MAGGTGLAIVGHSGAPAGGPDPGRPEGAAAGGPAAVMVGRMRARLVVLVSGAGTNLQALIDACADGSYGAAVVAVGADRPGIESLARAERAGIPTFIARVADHPGRAAWDRALAESVAAFDPDLVVSAGFMKLVGPVFLDRFEGRFINTHPALLPAFAGMHGVRDALDYGVKVTGCTVFMVDAGTDTGPVIAQAAVPVSDDDDVATLHERVKVAERALLVDTVGAMVRGGWSVQGRKVKVGR
jgi:phosphoribosylglycinamide formyltransferase-1